MKKVKLILLILIGSFASSCLAILILNSLSSSYLTSIDKIFQKKYNYKYFIQNCPTPENCLLVNIKTGTVYAFKKDSETKILEKYRVN